MLVVSSTTVVVDPYKCLFHALGLPVALTHIDGAKIVNSNDYCVISMYLYVYIDAMFHIVITASGFGFHLHACNFQQRLGLI